MENIPGKIEKTSPINSLIRNLEEYNSQFGFDETVRHAVLGMPEEALHREAEQLLAYENLTRSMEPILSDWGLSLEPVKKNINLTIVNKEGNQGTHTPTVMMLNIVDGKKFVEQLSLIDSDTLSDAVSSSLVYVANALISQLKSYDLEDSNNDLFLEFVGNLAGVAAEYRRLGMVEEANILETHQEWSRDGILKEHITAEKFHLDKPYTDDPAYKQNFALKWHHTDGSPEYLKMKWEEVFSALILLSQNPKTTDLYNQAKETAQKAIEEAIIDEESQRKTTFKNMDGSRKEDYILRRAPYLEVLKIVKLRLSEF